MGEQEARAMLRFLIGEKNRHKKDIVNIETDMETILKKYPQLVMFFKLNEDYCAHVLASDV